MTDCVIHSGREGEDARSTLDGIMDSLPNSQAGEGRHKCAYCAYEAGLRQGRIEANQETVEGLNVFIRGLERED